MGYIFSALLSGGLAYINLSESGATIFGWFLNLSSLVALLLWSVIFIVNIRLRKAWVIQGKELSSLPWKTKFNPYIAWYGLFWSILIVIDRILFICMAMEGNKQRKKLFCELYFCRFDDHNLCWIKDAISRALY